MSDLAISIPDALVGAITEAVTARLGGPPRDYMTTAEAAAYLRCLKADGTPNPNRLHKLAAQGRIPCRREGDRLLFLRGELDEWLDSGEAAL
jgi:hypothetical protein